MTNEGLRRRLDETRKQLLDALTGLTEEQMYRQVEPGEWSIAEVLAHLPVAERHTRSQAEAIQQETAVEIASLSLPEQQQSAARAQEMVPPQIIHDMTGARWQTLKFLDSLTAVDLEKVGTHERHGAMTVGAIIGRIAYHEENHTQQIRRLREKMAAEPDDSRNPDPKPAF